ncbi:MAG: hypothetical protein KTR28_02365 [Micavibrio sp.]|nr:hypothetical protein [Micavibrio sp.]
MTNILAQIEFFRAVEEPGQWSDDGRDASFNGQPFGHLKLYEIVNKINNEIKRLEYYINQGHSSRANTPTVQMRPADNFMVSLYNAVEGLSASLKKNPDLEQLKILNNAKSIIDQTLDAHPTLNQTPS